MRDVAYEQRPAGPQPQLQHHYGPKVNLVGCPLTWRLLAQLGHPKTVEPTMTRRVRRLYEILLTRMLAATWPTHAVAIHTRMAQFNPHRGIWHGVAARMDVPVVVVDIARAGTVPAQTVYEFLGDTFDPAFVRQDHLFMSRVTDATGSVTGVALNAQKTDGGACGHCVLIPDPMGATGSTLAAAADVYKKHPDGPPQAIIALHLIVTPEYLRAMAALHPDVQIWALRLDRGMSDAGILATTPGLHPHEERGLDERHYIIPGAGGMGELLNNTRS